MAKRIVKSTFLTLSFGIVMAITFSMYKVWDFAKPMLDASENGTQQVVFLDENEVRSIQLKKLYDTDKN